jgi:hypothetical protein
VVWPVAGTVPGDGALVEVTAVDGPRLVVAPADR